MWRETVTHKIGEGWIMTKGKDNGKEEKKKEIVEEPKEKKEEVTQLPEENEHLPLKEIIDQLEAEIKAGYRIYDTEHWGRLFIFLPNSEDEHEISRQYSRIYGSLIKDHDILTEKEMVRECESRGVWTKEDESNLKKLNEAKDNARIELIAVKETEDPDLKDIIEMKRVLEESKNL